ncbi:SMI1/KNR4 family protein [Rhodopirellula halodulae]|uniref:SMI1/KNR4 family protein n=1 Tax=Rhodopirellula halodulae TaxID=2894198 RepID=UPI001E43357D|nr:SMI1/KNR4 family protein [Rhodopirellula sp. JC737]MCC9657973.1 SMI1/KNR4 family protein [Rhodopirellula sp. JC737]
MSIGDIIAANLSRWVFANTGASDDDIRALTDATSFPLPSAYLDLLRAANGGEADIPDLNGDDGSYLDLWEAADVVQFNADYMLPRFAPSFFAFGSNGGGELFAFDSRRDDDAVLMVPTIGMSDDTSLPFADSVDAFAQRIAAP